MSCYDCKDKRDSLTSRLNKRVTPQNPPSGTDEYGQPNTQWTDWPKKIWAGIEPLQGREFFAAKAENAEVTTRIRIRYRTDIDRTMRIKYKTITFEILYIINPKMSNEELQLMCKERQ